MFLQRDIALAPLDLAHIAAVELALEGQRFLGEPRGFAQGAQPGAKLAGDIRGVCMRHAVPLCGA